MTDPRAALSVYDAAVRSYSEAQGYDAANQIPDVLEAAKDAVEAMRRIIEDHKGDRPTVTLIRQHLHTSMSFNVSVGLAERVSSIRNSAMDDNEHSYDPGWKVIGVDIVWTGKPVTSGRNTSQAVHAIVTEAKTERIGE